MRGGFQVRPIENGVMAVYRDARGRPREEYLPDDEAVVSFVKKQLVLMRSNAGCCGLCENSWPADWTDCRGCGRDLSKL